MFDFQYQPTTNTAGQKYVQPCIVNPTRQSSGVMGVWLSEGEEVDWHITTNPDGTQHCHGYTIRKKDQIVDHNQVMIGTIEPGLLDICKNPAAGEITVRLTDKTLDDLGF